MEMSRYWIDQPARNKSYTQYHGEVVIAPRKLSGNVLCYSADITKAFWIMKIPSNILRPFHLPVADHHSYCFCSRQKSNSPNT